jgi:hypothetical protein
MPLLQPMNIEKRRLTLRIALRLLGGHDWAFLDNAPSVEDDALRPHWERYREALMQFVQQTKRGAHPWGYYRFEKGISDPLARFEDNPWPALKVEDVEAWLEMQP